VTRRRAGEKRKEGEVGARNGERREERRKYKGRGRGRKGEREVKK